MIIIQSQGLVTELAGKPVKMGHKSARKFFATISFSLLLLKYNFKHSHNIKKNWKGVNNV